MTEMVLMKKKELGLGIEVMIMTEMVLMKKKMMMMVLEEERKQWDQEPEENIWVVKYLPNDRKGRQNPMHGRKIDNSLLLRTCTISQPKKKERKADSLKIKCAFITITKHVCCFEELFVSM